MVSAQPLHFAHFNYRNPCHKIRFSLQGNRSNRRNRRRHTEYFRERDKKRAEATALKRSLQSVGTHEEERVRRLITHEYGPPIFSVGEHVKIMKDTAPGAHPRFSYDKLGVIKSVIDGNGSNANLYTVKVLFEPCSVQVDEGWLQRCASSLIFVVK